MAARPRSRRRQPDQAPPREVSTDRPADAWLEPQIEMQRDNILAVVISLAMLLLVAVLVFFTPRMTGDTFMTIAGGQDVLDGKLGKPDDWASTTKDRVWINQSWGTGVLFHTAHRWLGYNGIVVIKALLIAALATFLVLGTWEFGVRPSVGIMASAAALSATRHFIDMRANVVGLTCLALLICILYWSGRSRHRIWWGVILVTIWSHMHGSFIFGTGMIGLWTLTYLSVAWFESRQSFRWSEHWPSIVATCLALALPALTSPLGVTNLTQPFTLLPNLQTDGWPIMAVEMRPIFNKVNKAFSGLREYFVLLSLLATPAIVWLLYCFDVKRPFWERRNMRRTVTFLFTLALVAVAVAMAIKARRFIPVALIVATPLVAFEIQWLLSHRWFVWPTVVCLPAAIGLGPYLESVWPADPAQHVTAPADLRKVWSVVALVILCLPILIMLLRPILRQVVKSVSVLPSFLGWLANRRRIQWASSILAVFMIIMTVQNLSRLSRHYRADNPFLPDEDLFGKMILYHEFPDAAAQFINDNQLEGNVFNEWKWEGFLRMHCPQLKVFLGGRSRQAYPASAAKQFVKITNGADPDLLSQAGINIRYLIITNKQSRLYYKVMLDTKFPWQVIFMDDRSVVAANQNNPEARRVTRDALAGRLTYPSIETEKVSLAVHRLTEKSSSSSARDIIGACEAANQIAPTPFVYNLIPHAVNRKKLGSYWMVRYMEAELARLESVDVQLARGPYVLYSRQRAAFVLSQHYASQNQNRLAQFWKDYSQQLTAVIAAMRQAAPLPTVDPLPSREELARMKS